MSGVFEVYDVGISDAKVENLVTDTRAVLETAFGPADIDFAFIAGSVAKSSAQPSSDVDVVVGLREQPSASAFADFRAGYFDLHERYGLAPDEEYPGEVFAREALQEALVKAEVTPPARLLTDMQVYDGIVWAGMLSAEKLLIIPESDILTRAAAIGSRIVKKYHTRIDHPCPPSGRVRNFDLCLKKFIEYQPI